ISGDADSAHVIGTTRSPLFEWRTASGTVVLSSVTCVNPSQNAYIASLRNDGTVAWTVAIDSPGNEGEHNGIATGCGAVFITGRTGNNAVFPGNVTVTQAGGSDLMFVD